VRWSQAAACISFAIAHEFGHALGYWHSSVKPSIMGGGQASCALYDLTPNEALIARVMYSREPGNLEPDKDSTTASAGLYPGERTLHLDRRRAL